MPGNGTDKSPEWKAVARERLEAWTSSELPGESPGESDGEEMTTLRFAELSGAKPLVTKNSATDRQTNPDAK